MFEKKVRLIGSSRAFIKGLRKTIEDIGFVSSVGARLPSGWTRAGDDGVVVYEAGNGADLDRALKRRSKTPFILFTRLSIDRKTLSGLKDKGLVGIISGHESPEDLAFVLNRALFFSRVLRKNLRVPVSVPVDIMAGTRGIATSSTHLSRDGMFVVTINPMPPETICTVKFSLPGIEKGFQSEAKVLYNISINKELNIIADPKDPFKRVVAHPGMAVFFIDMPEEDRRLIEGYIKGMD